MKAIKKQVLKRSKGVEADHQDIDRKEEKEPQTSSFETDYDSLSTKVADQLWNKLEMEAPPPPQNFRRGTRKA